MKNLIEIKNLIKTYKIGGETINAVDNITLDILEGEMVAITGPSGSGKSTLMHLIGGLDKPTKGDILVDSVNIAKLKDKHLSKYRNTTIGFVFQSFNLQPNLTSLENVKLPLMFSKNVANKAESALKALEMLDLKNRIFHKPNQLSGGQKQRVGIARALVNNPKIILADEPTGNLDSKNGSIVINLLREINKEKNVTIIIVTHDPNIANKCDREIRMKDGKIV